MEETGKKTRGRGRGSARGRGRGKGRGRGRGRKPAAVLESEDEQMQEDLDESGPPKSLDESMSSDKAISDEKPSSPTPPATTTTESSNDPTTSGTSSMSTVDEKESNEIRSSVPTIDMEADISQLEAPTFTTISRGPPEPMTRLKWDHKVNLIGEKVLNPMIHCCDQCENVKPILIYGRMIPCKHVFCLKCGREEPIKSCPRCKEKVVRVEQSGLGTVFMCTHGGSRYGTTGCRRTYLSQRDLQAHINHRHISLAATVEPKAVEQTRISSTGVRKQKSSTATGRVRSDSCSQSLGSSVSNSSSTHMVQSHPPSSGTGASGSRGESKTDEHFCGQNGFTRSGSTSSYRSALRNNSAGSSSSTAGKRSNKALVASSRSSGSKTGYFSNYGQSRSHWNQQNNR